MINSVLKIQLGIFVLIFITVVVVALYREKITIKYSLNWLSAGIVMLLGVLLPNLMKFVSSALGFKETSNMIFILGYIFLLYVTFNLTKVVSFQSKQIKLLIQEVSILKQKGEEKCK